MTACLHVNSGLPLLTMIIIGSLFSRFTSDSIDSHSKLFYKPASIEPDQRLTSFSMITSNSSSSLRGL